MVGVWWVEIPLDGPGSIRDMWLWMVALLKDECLNLSGHSLKIPRLLKKSNRPIISERSLCFMASAVPQTTTIPQVLLGVALMSNTGSGS